MSWLKSLFASDPREQLRKAEERLEGTPERALEMALEIHQADVGEAEEEIRSFIARARRRVVEQALERADASEAEEYFADAAEWLEAAIEHTADADEKKALIERRRELLRQELLLEEAEDGMDGPAMTLHRQVEASVLSPEVDVDDLFLSLVDMFEETVAERYRQLGPTFRRLFLQFQEAELEGLEEGLSTLLAGDSPEGALDADGRAVVQLERGRLRLLTGDLAAALEDFDACWDAWDDDPLDLAGTLSLPGLWAEAKVGTGDFDAIIERLPELARAEDGRLEVMLPFAQALVLSQRLDEAKPYLQTAMGSFPSHQDFPQLYALTLAASGNPQEAMACLEMAIAPSCASGSCSKPPMHMPSLQMLLSLHVSAGDDEGRLRRLGKLFVEHRHGQLSGEDHRLLAAVHQKLGEDIAAQLALEKAAVADAEGPRPELAQPAMAPRPSDRLIM